MKLFKRTERVLAKHDAMEADIKRRDGVPEPADEAAADPAAVYEEVCTPQGRRKHLRPHAMLGVLCGWPGRMIPADPSMEECLMCQAALRAMGEEVAS